TLRAQGNEEESEALLTLVAADAGVTNNETAVLAKVIKGHLVTVREGDDSDPIGLEADAAIRILDAITAGQQEGALALKEVGATDLEVGTNARLLMASSALQTIRVMKRTTAIETTQAIARQYPYPC